MRKRNIDYDDDDEQPYKKIDTIVCLFNLISLYSLHE